VNVVIPVKRLCSAIDASATRKSLPYRSIAPKLSKERREPNDLIDAQKGVKISRGGADDEPRRVTRSREGTRESVRLAFPISLGFALRR
jgi:hypothetical protein